MEMPSSVSQWILETRKHLFGAGLTRAFIKEHPNTAMAFGISAAMSSYMIEQYGYLLHSVALLVAAKPDEEDEVFEL